VAQCGGARWSREQIRAARLVPLAPLLQQRGLQLIEASAGNYHLPAYPGPMLIWTLARAKPGSA
jgi:hypothetical protein